MSSLPSLVVAASALFAASSGYAPPDISNVAPIALACPRCSSSSRDADRQPHLPYAATSARPEASDEATARATSGDVHVSIKEWRTPTPRSHPHDPLVTVDGAIWYTGQMANLLGRLDPKTGQFREYHLKTPDSGPHGLVADANGAIWFTASFKGYIGKLNPATGEVQEFKLPDPAARDPHTPVFDKKGIM